MVQIIQNVMSQLDKNPAKDYITAKKIMKVCNHLHVGEGRDQKLLREFIKECDMWHDTRFWEEYFLDELFKKHRQYLPESAGDDVDFVTTLCCSFGKKKISHFAFVSFSFSFSFFFSDIFL